MFLFFQEKGKILGWMTMYCNRDEFSHYFRCMTFAGNKVPCFVHFTKKMGLTVRFALRKNL